MKHAYVIFDNDAPLWICEGEEHANAVLRAEKERLYQELVEPVLEKRKQRFAFQTENDVAEAELKLSHHFLHYHLVPYAQRRGESSEHL